MNRLQSPAAAWTAWLTIVAAALFLTGCQLATTIADSAPPASPPLLDSQPSSGIVKCPLASRVFLTRDRFAVSVRSAYWNQVTVELVAPGVPRALVPEFDGNDPNNGLRTTFIRKSISSDVNAGWRKDEYTFFSPWALWTAGSTLTLVFTERSINPSYKGTPQETAVALLTGVSVNSPSRASCPIDRGPSGGWVGGPSPTCKLDLFTAPTSVRVGDFAMIDWRVLDCLKVQLLKDGLVYDEKSSISGNAEKLEGNEVVRLQTDATFNLRVFTSPTASPTSVKLVAISTSAQCPGGTPEQIYTFCVKCGTAKNRVDYGGCTEALAKMDAENEHGGCTISAGVCP